MLTREGLTVALSMLIALAMWVPVIVYAVRGGFRKPPTKPNHARLIAKPGAMLDLVDDHGTVVAKVILRDITYDYREGTSVQFVDYARYLERHTVR